MYGRALGELVATTGVAAMQSVSLTVVAGFVQ